MGDKTPPNLERDIREAGWMTEKIRTSSEYAQNVYAALCNNLFQPQQMWSILKEETWCCSWRYAGGVVADIRQQGDYLDWYCSGSGIWMGDGKVGQGYVTEGLVTEEVREDLRRLGWQVCDRYDDT
jgi:hypothetical protein